MIIIKDTKPQDLIVLATNMRQAEIDEVKTLNNRSPIEAVLYSWKESIECKSVFENGILLMIFGVFAVNFMGRYAGIWALSTKSMDKCNKFAFIKESISVVKNLTKRYGVLSNTADKKHEKNKRWLKLLGAKFRDKDDKSFEFEIG